MSLTKFLKENQKNIVKKWREDIINTYPVETQNFLKKEKDRFANPVGFIIGKEVETLFSYVTDESGDEEVVSALDKIVRVRAVQDFTPSDAVRFLEDLKEIIREVSEKAGNEEWTAKGVYELDRKIDSLIFKAFDIYMQCRQKINDLRVKEIKNEVGRVLERAQLARRGPIQEKGFDT